MERLEELIRDSFRRDVKMILDDEVRMARDRLEERIRETVATWAVNISDQLDFYTNIHELVIKVDFKKVEGWKED